MFQDDPAAHLHSASAAPLSPPTPESMYFEKGNKLEFPGGVAVKDVALSLLWLGFDSWPQELPHASSEAKKEKDFNPLR